MVLCYFSVVFCPLAGRHSGLLQFSRNFSHLPSPPPPQQHCLIVAARCWSRSSETRSFGSHKQPTIHLSVCVEHCELSAIRTGELAAARPDKSAPSKQQQENNSSGAKRTTKKMELEIAKPMADHNPILVRGHFNRSAAGRLAACRPSRSSCFWPGFSSAAGRVSSRGR